MRWLTFLVLLYITSALQFAHFLAWPHAHGPGWPTPQYLVILAAFYALHAEEHVAPLCGLAAGLMFDLGPDLPLLGTGTVAMGLVAWGIVRIRLSIFREHPVSQGVLTFLAVLAFGVISGLLRTLWPASYEPTRYWPYVGGMAGDAVYSGLLAPAAFWLFFRLRPMLGFGSHGLRGRI